MEMQFKYDHIEMRQIMVTPELAATMLATSPGNRVIRQWWVDALVALAQRGEWKITHQGIGFDTNGHVRDGHHRLLLILASGLTLPMVVMFGLEPTSFDAVDQGVRRTLSDVLGLEKRITEPLRMATTIVRRTSQPTAQQVEEVSLGGLYDALSAVVQYCGGARTFYSSSPVKLAAAISMMAGQKAEFVLRQYRSLVCLSFDEMTPSAKGLVRQVQAVKARSNNAREAFARCLRVFDESRSNVARIQVSDADVVAALEMCREVVLDSLGELQKRPRTVTRSHNQRQLQSRSDTQQLALAA